MTDWFEHDWQTNTLTLTSLPGSHLEYDDALIIFEELEERLQDMERRAQQQDEEDYADHQETDAMLTRIWYE